MAAYKITVTYDGILSTFVEPDFADHKTAAFNDYVGHKSPLTQYNVDVMTATRIGGPEELNIWIVSGVTSGTKKPGGVSLCL